VAKDDGVPVDKSKYANRQLLPDFTATPCPETQRTLVQVRGELYRHTSGTPPDLRSGLVLITREGALVIDPAQTCTSGWLKDEIQKRFRVPVRYT
jgi:hypothetical protein